MKRSILCILFSMLLSLATQQTSAALTLSYISGGVSSYASIEENWQRQYDQNYAHASNQASGLSAEASAYAGATSSGGYYVSLMTSVASSLNNYYVNAHGYTSGGPEGNEGFILLQVTASSGDTSNSGQLEYSSSYNTQVYVPDWDYSYFPLVITVNGKTKVNQYPAGIGFLDVVVGDIIGLDCRIFADNLANTGACPSGSMSSWLGVSLDPVNSVPIPGSFSLLGSGLLGLLGLRWRFRKN
jgi:hypothetical protein